MEKRVGVVATIPQLTRRPKEGYGPTPFVKGLETHRMSMLGEEKKKEKKKRIKKEVKSLFPTLY